MSITPKLSEGDTVYSILPSRANVDEQNLLKPVRDQTNNSTTPCARFRTVNSCYVVDMSGNGLGSSSLSLKIRPMYFRAADINFLIPKEPISIAEYLQTGTFQVSID